MAEDLSEERLLERSAAGRFTTPAAAAFCWRSGPAEQGQSSVWLMLHEFKLAGAPPWLQERRQRGLRSETKCHFLCHVLQMCHSIFHQILCWGKNYQNAFWVKMQRTKGLVEAVPDYGDIICRHASDLKPRFITLPSDSLLAIPMTLHLWHRGVINISLSINPLLHFHHLINL